MLVRSGEVQRKAALFGAVASIAGAIAGPALAQTTSPPAAFGGARQPQTLEGLSGSARAAVRYDPQAARGDDTVAAARALDQKELIYTADASLGGGRDVAGFSLGLNGSANYVWHQKNDALDTNTYRANASISRIVGPCAVSTGASGSQLQSLLEQDNFAYVRNTQKTYAYTGSLNCSGLAGIQAGVQGAYNSEDNSLPASRSSKSQQISGNIGYGNQVLGAIDIFVAQVDADYDNGGLLGGVNVGGVKSTNYGLRYSRPLIRNLTGSATIGQAITRPDGVLSGEEKNFTGSAQFDYRANNGLRATLGYNQGVQASDLSGTSFNYSRSFDGSLSYTFGRGLNVRLAAAYRLNRYRGQIILPTLMLSDLMDLTRSRDQNYRVDVSYPLGDRITTSVGYTYGRSNVDSVIPLGLSPISQLERQQNHQFRGSVGLELPFNSLLALDATYETRTASDEAFEYKAFKAGASLSIRF